MTGFIARHVALIGCLLALSLVLPARADPFFVRVYGRTYKVDPRYPSGEKGPKPQEAMKALPSDLGRGPGFRPSHDEVLAEVLNAQTPAVCLVGKTHDFHVATALNVSLEENLENIATSVRFLRAKGREALFDAEHFFDGWKANPDYALACLQAALAAGAAFFLS